MDLPLFPGVPTVRGMKGYGQFCPVAVASEIFAERWTPLILRELIGGSHRFNDIRQGVPLISRTLLAQRLASWKTPESWRASHCPVAGAGSTS